MAAASICARCGAALSSADPWEGSLCGSCQLTHDHDAFKAMEREGWRDAELRASAHLFGYAAVEEEIDVLPGGYRLTVWG